MRFSILCLLTSFVYSLHVPTSSEKLILFRRDPKDDSKDKGGKDRKDSDQNSKKTMESSFDDLFESELNEESESKEDFFESKTTSGSSNGGGDPRVPPFNVL